MPNVVLRHKLNDKMETETSFVTETETFFVCNSFPFPTRKQVPFPFKWECSINRHKCWIFNYHRILSWREIFFVPAK